MGAAAADERSGRFDELESTAAVVGVFLRVLVPADSDFLLPSSASERGMIGFCDGTITKVTCDNQKRL